MTDIIERLRNSLLPGHDPKLHKLRNADIAEAANALTEAAAFLDGLADRIAGFDERLDQATTDCRAMAERLRK